MHKVVQAQRLAWHRRAPPCVFGHQSFFRCFLLGTDQQTDRAVQQGWTITSTTETHFFARPPHSRGHLFPQLPPSKPDPFCLSQPNIIRWPDTTPDMFSPSLPSDSCNAARPVPSFISQAAQIFFQLGTQKMFSPNTLLSEFLQPTDTIPHFSKEHMAILTSAQVRQDFDFHILTPIKAGNFDAIDAYLNALLPPPPSTQAEQPWTLARTVRKPPASTVPPLNDILQLQSSSIGKTLFHLDNFNSDLAHFPRPPKVWIKVSILPNYTGIGTCTFTILSHGINKPLTETLIKAFVAINVTTAAST